MSTQEQPDRKRKASKQKIQESDITGLKYFDQLAPLLQRLHDDGCQRDRAGNRKLHYDHYCMLLLLFLFNPIVTSLRGVQQASELKKVQKKLGCARASLGSLSEATSVFEADRLYVTDRGYAKFTLFNQIVDANSSYVCRLRDNSVWTVVEENYRNDDADLDEIISDEIVEFSKGSGLNHKVRVICIRVNPHTSRGKYRGGSSGVDSDGILRIATNLLDVPAEVISLIFSNRWAVEIFFRFFKHILGCRHLLSHDQNGIEIQTYCAIIACMLIALWTGKKPTLRTYEMICFYFTGLADEDELMTHIEKLKSQDT